MFFCNTCIDTSLPSPTFPWRRSSWFFIVFQQGTVAIAGGGFIAQSKRLPGVEVVEITQSDRDAKTQEVAKKFLKDQICKIVDGGWNGSLDPMFLEERCLSNWCWMMFVWMFAFLRMFWMFGFVGCRYGWMKPDDCFEISKMLDMFVCLHNEGRITTLKSDKQDA